MLICWVLSCLLSEPFQPYPPLYLRIETPAACVWGVPRSADFWLAGSVGHWKAGGREREYFSSVCIGWYLCHQLHFPCTGKAMVTGNLHLWVLVAFFLCPSNLEWWRPPALIKLIIPWLASQLFLCSQFSILNSLHFAYWCW